MFQTDNRFVAVRQTDVGNIFLNVSYFVFAIPICWTLRGQLDPKTLNISLRSSFWYKSYINCIWCFTNFELIFFTAIKLLFEKMAVFNLLWQFWITFTFVLVAQLYIGIPWPVTVRAFACSNCKRHCVRHGCLIDYIKPQNMFNFLEYLGSITKNEFTLSIDVKIIQSYLIG